MDEDLLLYPGYIHDDQIFPNRRGTGNPSYMPIYKETIGSPKSAVFCVDTT